LDRGSCSKKATGQCHYRTLAIRRFNGSSQRWLRPTEQKRRCRGKQTDPAQTSRREPAPNMHSDK
jgi:hypothetical protein